LSKMPIMGLIFRNILVLVDRGDHSSRKASIKKMGMVLRNGTSLLVFPEGTMNRTSEVLTPFHDGAFRIALETKTPIVPMVIQNSRKLMPQGKAHVKPGLMPIIFLQVQEVDNYGLKDVKVLKSKIYDMMKSKLDHEID